MSERERERKQQLTHFEKWADAAWWRMKGCNQVNIQHLIHSLSLGTLNNRMRSRKKIYPWGGCSKKKLLGLWQLSLLYCIWLLDLWSEVFSLLFMSEREWVSVCVYLMEQTDARCKVKVNIPTLEPMDEEKHKRQHKWIGLTLSDWQSFLLPFALFAFGF